MFLYDRINIVSSSEIFDYLRDRSQSSEFSENVGNDFLDFGQLLENLRESSESVRKSSQKRQEHNRTA